MHHQKAFLRIAAVTTSLNMALLVKSRNEDQEQSFKNLNSCLVWQMLTGLQRPAEALIPSEEDSKRLHSINTNCYVWGEGVQVDPTQDYSNFTPKKIQ